MIHVEAPVNYRHWTGRIARLHRADRLEDDWSDVTVEWRNDLAIYRIPLLANWQHLGFAPVSRTRWARFWRHWHHGRLMGYPRLSVLVFCLQEIRFRARQLDPLESSLS